MRLCDHRWERLRCGRGGLLDTEYDSEFVDQG